MTDTRLKTWLAEQGLTQTELAAQLGYKFELVNRVANGARPTKAFLWKFFARYGEAITIALFDTEEAAG